MEGARTGGGTVWSPPLAPRGRRCDDAVDEAVDAGGLLEYGGWLEAGRSYRDSPLNKSQLRACLI